MRFNRWRRPATASLGKTATLFPRFPPRLQGSRARDQRGSLPLVQLDIEANTNIPAAFPPDHRRTAEGAAVEDHGRSNRQACRTIQLRACGRQVEKLDGMALSLSLEKRRHRHRDAWIDAAVLVRRTVLSGRSGFCHVRSGVTAGYFQSMNATVRNRWKADAYPTPLKRNGNHFKSVASTCDRRVSVRRGQWTKELWRAR